MIKEKAKKEFCLLLAVMLLFSLLAGCSDSTSITLNADSSGSYEEVLTASKSFWDMAVKEIGSEDSILSHYRTLYPKASVTLEETSADGTAYKALRLKMNFKNAGEFQQIMSAMNMMSVKFNSKYFSRASIYMPLEDDESDSSAADELAALAGENQELLAALNEEMKDMDVLLTITFPYPVTETNGSVQEDGKTVLWRANLTDNIERVYALFDKQDADSAPAYSGAKNGGNYNTGVTLTVNSKNLLDKVVVNGETTASDYLFLSAEGVYTVKAVDMNKKSAKIKFRIDTTKPAVSGAANGKTYKKPCTIKFSDKGSGIKKAVLNGRTIKSGTKITKKGSYTLAVTDKAGNKKTVKFKIK